MWLALDELETLQTSVKGFSCSRWAPLEFRRQDYLGEPEVSLQQAALERMSELAGKTLRRTGLFAWPGAYVRLLFQSG